MKQRVGKLVEQILGVASPGQHEEPQIRAAEQGLEALGALIEAEGDGWPPELVRRALGALNTVLAEAGAYDLESRSDPSPEVRAELQRMRVIRERAAEALLSLLARKAFAGLRPYIESEVEPLVRGAVDRFLPFRVLKAQAITERLHGFSMRTDDPATKALLARLYSTKYPRFGTSGFRARWPDDFSEQRLAAVVAAICDHIEHDGLAELPVVIGYDSRVRADHMAQLAAGVCLARGLRVHLMTRDTPSPALIYYATHVLGADANAGLINCTPSHNPVRSVETGVFDDREYHGIRYNQPTGCVSPTDVTDAIGAAANRRLLDETPVPVLPLDEAGDCLTWVDDALERYTDWLLEKLEHRVQLPDGSEATGAELIACHFGASVSPVGQAALPVQNAPPRIVIDEMHSAARGYLRRVLDHLNVPYEVLHGEQDPTLGELAYANPEREHLHTCAERVKELSTEGAAAIGVGMDTDSDRFGVVDASGEFITPNQIILLLGRYLIEARYPQRRGVVVRTLSTTRMLDRIADANRDRVVGPDDPVPPHARHPFYRAVLGDRRELASPLTHVVAVGFKYLAGAMLAAGNRLEARRDPARTSSAPSRRPDTPVGPMAAELRRAAGSTFIAGEESGGLTTMDHTLDKDGLWANLLVLEMCAYYQKTPRQLWDEIGSRYGATAWTQRFDAMAPDIVKEDLVDSYLQEYETNPRASCHPERSEGSPRGCPVEIPRFARNDRLIGDHDAVFVGGVGGDMVETVLAQPSTGERAHLLIRSSGTEPMVRIYVEAPTEEVGRALLAAAQDRLDQMTADAIAEAASDWALAQILTDTAVLHPPHQKDVPLVEPEMAGKVAARLAALYPEADDRVERFLEKLETLAPAVAADCRAIALD